MSKSENKIKDTSSRGGPPFDVSYNPEYVAQLELHSGGGQTISIFVFKKDEKVVRAIFESYLVNSIDFDGESG